MQRPDNHYQLPDSTDASLRGMAVGLSLFFGTLIVIVALLLFFAQQLVQYIPFSAEQRFVRPYETLISRFFADEAGDPEMAEYLQELSDSLKEAMEIPPEIELSIHFIESDDVNAFATLGGHIFVFSGLAEALPDENSLAMVLAHEMAHIRHRDPLAGMSRGMAIQMLVGFMTGGTTNVEDLMSTAGSSGLASFSREQERQADVAALQALNTHFGHVNGYRSFFEYVKKIENEATANGTDMPTRSILTDWISTHPPIDERLRYLDKQVEAMNATTQETLALPLTIRELLDKKS